LDEINARLEASPDIWRDQSAAVGILKEKRVLEELIDQIQNLQTKIDDCGVLLDFVAEENDQDSFKEAKELLEVISKEADALELKCILSGETDSNDTFLSINAGAGGTESCDWVEMILRMFTRWAEDKGYKVEIVDILAGEEAGIKNVMLTVQGLYAYGYLKAESGIHRLVRISPFDSNARRHTSFASVYASPIIDDTIDVEVNEKDLRIDTYRSSGAGGQHVNKTDSAIRITHFPTGIVVQCQKERSQHQNREVAMQLLRSKLYELELEKKQKDKASSESEKKDIAWGSQIRSYVLHPYNLVKDHRTGYETGNTQGVLDGELDGFIKAYLLQQA